MNAVYGALHSVELRFVSASDLSDVSWYFDYRSYICIQTRVDASIPSVRQVSYLRIRHRGYAIKLHPTMAFMVSAFTGLRDGVAAQILNVT